MKSEPSESAPPPQQAFGAPGAEPRWTQSTKEGIGAAYHPSCRLVTLSNEEDGFADAIDKFVLPTATSASAP